MKKERRIQTFFLPHGEQMEKAVHFSLVVMVIGSYSQ
jgi:hypothetical protein